MERALILWIADCGEINVPFDASLTRTKAKTLYDTLALEGGDGDEEEGGEGGDGDAEQPQPGTSQGGEMPSSRRKGFVASKGWFEQFKKRSGLRSLVLHGEAASADTGAAKRYVEEGFPKIIKEGGYVPEQVFNMDKTALFWTRMPSRTFLFQEETRRTGFKPHKDRLTLLNCGNAAGDTV